MHNKFWKEICYNVAIITEWWNNIYFHALLYACLHYLQWASILINRQRNKCNKNKLFQLFSLELILTTVTVVASLSLFILELPWRIAYGCDFTLSVLRLLLPNWRVYTWVLSFCWGLKPVNCFAKLRTGYSQNN